jgi:hypothetical protein
MKALIRGKIVNVEIEKRIEKIKKRWFFPDKKEESILISWNQVFVDDKGKDLYSNRVGAWIDAKDLIEDANQ